MNLRLLLVLFFGFFFLFHDAYGAKESHGLEEALKGEKELKIMTMTRSGSNNLTINIEKEILLSVFDYLMTGKEHKFDEFNEVLNSDIDTYLKISEKMKKIKKERETDLLLIKMRISLDDIVQISETNLRTFVAGVLKNDGLIKKDDKAFRELFGQKSDNIWDSLTEYNNDISEVKIQDILTITDSDALNLSENLEDIAIYQSFNEIISAINIEPNNKENLQKMLFSYYKEQFKVLMNTVDKVQKKFSSSALTLFVTNEYFWGKVPIAVDEAHSLMERFSSLKDVLFCSNFLLFYDVEDHTTLKEYPKQLYEQNTNNIKLYQLMESNFSFERQKSDLQKYIEYLDSKDKFKGGFKNESMIFWGGKCLAKYDKATYFHEQDSLFQKEFIYEFGRGQDTITDESKESSIVHDLVSMQICRDSVAQIRKDDIGKQQYHILQSNTVKFNGEAIPKNVEYAIHVNFGPPATIYKRTANYSSIPEDIDYAWDPVGPFDWHLNFRLGISNYHIQMIRIGK